MPIYPQAKQGDNINVWWSWKVNCYSQYDKYMFCNLQYKFMVVEILALLITLYVLNRYFSGGTFTGLRPDLRGQFAVITGGNSGIGKQTALDLVKLGCFVIIGARDTKKSQKVVDDIKKKTNSDAIQHYYLDLSDKASIDEFVAKIKTDTLHFLINNAGVMAFPKRLLTKQGFEMQYAVNHLGHFYLTYLLWKKLNSSRFFRIINVSSLAHKREAGITPAPQLNFQDMSFEKSKYTPTISYSYSKIYNVLFTHALAERIQKGKGVAYSLHPGFVRTELTRYILPSPFSYILYLLYPLYFLISKSPFQGAQTTFYLLYSKIEELKNGSYYADCALSSENKEITKQNWDKLWEISERDLSIKFKV